MDYYMQLLTCACIRAIAGGSVCIKRWTQLTVRNAEHFWRKTIAESTWSGGTGRDTKLQRRTEGFPGLRPPMFWSLVIWGLAF